MAKSINDATFRRAFGRVLKRVRKERKLSQDALGEKIGVSGVSISLWERGENVPGEERRRDLERALDCNLERIVAADVQNGVLPDLAQLGPRLDVNEKTPELSHERFSFTITRTGGHYIAAVEYNGHAVGFVVVGSTYEEVFDLVTDKYLTIVGEKRNRRNAFLQKMKRHKK